MSNLKIFFNFLIYRSQLLFLFILVKFLFRAYLYACRHRLPKPMITYLPNLSIHLRVPIMKNLLVPINDYEIKKVTKYF
jgi:hypothetical protein